MPKPTFSRMRPNGHCSSGTRPPRGRAFLGLGLAVLSIVASLVSAPKARADVLDKLVIGAAAADLATSEIALSRRGTAEANPLGPNPLARAAMKAAGTAAILVVSRKLGHKTSRILKVVTFVAWSGVAIHNLEVQR